MKLKKHNTIKVHKKIGNEKLSGLEKTKLYLVNNS
jgi:hypothetical protein